MIRGIKLKFKQPIFYSFVLSGTKSEELVKLIKKVVKLTLQTGLKIIATVCDQSSMNVSAINKLVAETKKKNLESGKESDKFFSKL